MPRLLVHSDSRNDIDVIGNQEIAAKIFAFLHEAKTTPALLDTFTVHDFGVRGVDQFNVSRWEEQQRLGRNLWRIKLFALEDDNHYFRIVYAFDPPTHDHFVLGVARRNFHEPGYFNYSNEHPFTQGVISLYDDRIRR